MVPSVVRDAKDFSNALYENSLAMLAEEQETVQLLSFIATDANIADCKSVLLLE